MREEAYLEKLVTIGAHSCLSLQLFDGSLINVAIIDTAGQEKFRSMNNQYLNKVDGILLVYDITSEDSFEEIKNYYCADIKEYCKENVKIILVGNKSDLEDIRKIKIEDGASFAAENGYMFMETSCLKNFYVSECFETLIELCYKENEVVQNKAKNYGNKNNRYNNYQKFKELYKYINF